MVKSYMKKLLDYINDWKQKGANDLASACKLINTDEAITDTGCFHCQQAVEKYLKAFLLSKNIEFKNTHSLTYLLELCIDVSTI